MRSSFPGPPCSAASSALSIAALHRFHWPSAPPLRAKRPSPRPDGRNQVTVELREGHLTYSLDRDGRALILPSLLGFEFRGAAAAPRRPENHRHHPAVPRRMVDPALGRSGPGARPPQRAGGLGGGDRGARAGASPSGFAPSTTASGFRYELPEQPGLGAFEITEELTEFALADNSRAWWIPSNRPRMDRSEMLYSSAPVEHARQRADSAHHGDRGTAGPSW